MQLIGGLFTSLIGGGAAAGAVATGASSGLTLLQGLATTVGVISQIGAGIAQGNELKAQAMEQQFQSREEFIRGKETDAALKLELAKTIGNQTVAFAAGGVDLGSVSAVKAKAQATQDAERELSINSAESLSRSLARKRAAANLRAKASSAVMQGVLGGLETGIDFGINVANRG